MSALAPAVKGWCPGALRPMPARDGLLVRVRVSGGRLTLDQAAAIATAARDSGNGTIEISSRANLQLRGIAKAKLDELHSRLADFGLIDADPDVERIRNIVASPLSDLDPEAILDVTPMVAALEARLASDAELRALPAKFGFVIDGGGRWLLDDAEADVRFNAFQGAGGIRFAVRLNGEPQPRPATGGEGSSVERAATCAPQDLPEVAARLARAFLTLGGRDADVPRRMRGLVERVGAAAVFAGAGLTADAVVPRARAGSPSATVGVLDLGARAGLGAAPPFGRMSAEAFAGLARSARAEGACGLRLTPWRTIVIVGFDATRAAPLASRLEALGFIVSPGDPRLGVVACPGAPACAHAEADTQADAGALSALLHRTRGIVLHVSGCAKGCARASSTPLTLVATAAGYDLVVDGRAGDRPTRRGLSFGQAAAAVKTLTEGRAA